MEKEFIRRIIANSPEEAARKYGQTFRIRRGSTMVTDTMFRLEGGTFTYEAEKVSGTTSEFNIFIVRS